MFIKIVSLSKIEQVINSEKTSIEEQVYHLDNETLRQSNRRFG